jgi:predicted PurR-regulated permease PerM
VVLVPAGFVATLAVLEGLSLVDRIEIASVPERITTLREQFDLTIPQASDLNLIELSIERWHEQQQNGDTPQYSNARIDNLLKRVDSLQGYLDHTTAMEKGPSILEAKPYLASLRGALEDLKKAERETVDADNALAACEANFRVFKREFLGGTYQAWLKELANPNESQLKSIRSSLLGLANASDDSPQQGRVISRNSPLVKLGGNTIAGGAKVLFGAVIMMISLFFFLAEGSRMIDGIVRLSPLEERYLREMIAEFERVSRAVVAATLLAAVAQGILAGIGFYFAGLTQSVALLMIITMLLAMVPFMGAAAVWIPVCLYLYIYEGKMVPAALLAVYGTFVISTADNVIKPIVLHGQSNLHPLLALLSVLGGIATLGPIGIMVGPMAVVFLQTLLKILQREMLSLDTANRLPLAAWASGLTGKDPSTAQEVVGERVAGADAAGEHVSPAEIPTVPPSHGTNGNPGGSASKKKSKRRK